MSYSGGQERHNSGSPPVKCINNGRPVMNCYYPLAFSAYGLNPSLLTMPFVLLHIGSVQGRNCFSFTVTEVFTFPRDPGGQISGFVDQGSCSNWALCAELATMILSHRFARINIRPRIRLNRGHFPSSLRDSSISTTSPQHVISTRIKTNLQTNPHTYPLTNTTSHDLQRRRQS